MNNKKFLLVLFVIFFLSFIPSGTILADDDESVDTSGNISDLLDMDSPAGKFIFDLWGAIYDIEYTPYDYMDEPKEERDGGVELEIEKYPIERYMVNNEDTSGVFGFSLYAINNFFMGIIQNVVQVTDSALQLFTLNNLDDFADDVESVSSNIYDVLKEHFAELLFAFLCAYLVFIFFTKGNSRESFRKFGLFIVVLVIAGYWISNASFLLKSMNALSGELQAKIVSAGDGILDIFDDEREGVYAGIDNINEDEKIEGTIAVLRNIYFDLALKRPYLLINYGTTNEDKINDKDNIKDIGFGFQEYKRSERMLSFKLSSEGSGYRIAHAHLEVIKNNNESLASGSSFKQSGIVFLTFFIVIGLSVPFLLLGLINFALQLLAVLLALFLPFAFILSFIPHFVLTGIKSIGNILTIFITKGLLGILLFIVYLLTYTMFIMVEPDSTGTYLLHVVLLIVIFFLIIIKRNKIISFITAGRVQTVDGNIMPNMNQYYSNQYSNFRDRIKRKRSKERESPTSNIDEKESGGQQNSETDRTSMVDDKESVNENESSKSERTPQRENKENDDKEKVEKEGQSNSSSQNDDGNETERNRQEEGKDVPEFNEVNKEGQSNSSSQNDDGNEAERNRHEEGKDVPEFNEVNKEGQSNSSSQNDGGNEAERNRQEEGKDVPEFNEVNKEGQSNSSSQNDGGNRADRNEQEEGKDVPEFNKVNKEGQSNSSTKNDGGNGADRNKFNERIDIPDTDREVPSVEEGKKERDEN